MTTPTPAEAAPGAASESVALAEWIAEFPDRLPEQVETKIKVHLLDTLGCQVAFASLPWSVAAASIVRQPAAAGPSTVALTGDSVGPAAAAFANACFAHGFEMDDTEMRTASHPGAVVVPASLAMAQMAGADGPGLLRAVGLGYEVMVRVGLAGVGMMKRGFHTTAVAGAVGAAAAAAAVSGLDGLRIRHALGIAASRASGVTEYAVSGGSVKRVHAGFAAQAGVEAAGLAAAGISAPAAALEGPRGLLRAIDDRPAPSALSAGLGEDYELLTTGLKPYCCCAGQHTVLDAVASLQERVPGLTADSVARIEVRQRDREMAVVGRIKEPRDVVSAQFSAAFGIALRLTRRSNGFRDYLDAPLDDDVLRRIASCVSYGSLDGQLEGDGPASVTIELHDGSRHHEVVQYARGSVRRPMTMTEVLEKFHGLADDPLGPDRAARVVDAVMNLEEWDDMDRLAGLLVARRGYEPPSGLARL